MPLRPTPLIVAVMALLSLPTPATATAQALEAELKALRAESHLILQRLQQLEEKLAQQKIDAATAHSYTETDLAADRSSPALPSQPNTLTPKTDAPPLPPTANLSPSAAAQEEARHTPPPTSPELALKKSQFILGGRARMEVIGNFPSTGGSHGGDNAGDYYLFGSAVPMDSQGEEGQVTLSARSSRLWLKTETSTSLGSFKTHTEMDFWGSSGNENVSNSHNPRLRHVYGTLGNFTFGQTSSTFINGRAWPSSQLDPVGILYVRQPLLRYTWALDDGDIQVGLEQPESTLLNSAGESVQPDDDRLPDIAVKRTWEWDEGHFALSGIVRELRADGTIIPDRRDSVLGGALYASGAVNLLEKDNLSLGLAWGEPLGRYATYNAFKDGVIDDAGEIHPLPLVDGYLSYQHWWNDSWRSVVSIAGAAADNDLDVVADTVPKWVTSYHLNLGMVPQKNLYFGLEYAHAQKELENGDHGDLDRLIFMTSYDFEKIL
ncbi:MAG: hypothetical protein HQL52_05745 [Magnetococcales bacterium]|nr:hypothetical protein [Magnetococcales bacterium]